MTINTERRQVNWDLWLTILFYLFALASLIAFFAYREEMPRLFVYLGCTAVVCRVIYYIKRFIQ